MTHWLGGIGIVVLFVAVAPLLGVGAARLIGAEMSGLTQPRLTPRIADTAKALVVIYLAISAAETVALLLARMPLYDAVVHTFGTVATGGFQQQDRVGWLLRLARHRGDHWLLHGGIGRLVLALLPALHPAPARRPARQGAAGLPRDHRGGLDLHLGILVLEGDYGASWGRALRDSAFAVSSIITTTGFITADFDRWDAAAQITLILLMFIGGCAGSTAGGSRSSVSSLSSARSSRTSSG